MIALLIGSVLCVQVLGFPPTQSFEELDRATPRFKSNASSVYLEVVVTGPSQLFLPGLTVDDFEVLEDGVRQEVSLFSSDDVAPVTLLLLLDASTSIAGSEGAIKKASSNLVREMSLRDQAAVVIFNDTIMESTHFTTLQEPLLKVIRSLHARGSTALYDAILHALDKLSRIEGRKALLVFTDGTYKRIVICFPPKGQERCREGLGNVEIDAEPSCLSSPDHHQSRAQPTRRKKRCWPMARRRPLPLGDDPDGLF